MPEEPGKGEGNPALAHQLLSLALSRPHEALARSRAVLAARPPALDASIARQAAGIGLREIGDLPSALREMRAALRLARASGRRDREVDVLATLGATLTRAGRSQQGLAMLDEAIRHAQGALAGRVMLRRADALFIVGRYAEALEDLRGAVVRLRRAGDLVWEARSLAYRGFVNLALGETGRADADFAVVERLHSVSGQELEYAMARNNRGLAAFARGDLPKALEYLDDASRRFEALATPDHDVAIDRVRVLLAAGLTHEALRQADEAVQRLVVARGQAAKNAELLFTAASAALAAGDLPAARIRAGRALRLFRAQGRDLWAARAEFLAVQARYLAGDRGLGLFRQSDRLADHLDRCRADEAAAAHLLAARLAVLQGRAVAGEQHFERAARSRRRGPPLARGAAWLAQALRAQSRGEIRSMLAACDRGLDALDEHRLTLGATELQAHATAHGAELAMLAQREALRRGDARRLLACSERWRSTALALAPARPPDDPELVAELAALRDLGRRLEGAHPDGAPAALLRRERRRLEDAVRARTLRTPGLAGGIRGRFQLDALLDVLGASCLVELVEVDGLLHVLVVRDERVSHHAAGPMLEAERAVTLSRFALRRLAYGRWRQDAAPSLDAIGRRLEEALLGPAAALLGDGPVVVVPPGRLHAVPWALLPSLRDRVVSAAPSATAWLRMSELRAPSPGAVTLVVGPGLASMGGEVQVLAGLYPGSIVLGNGSATAEKVLAALDGARLAHVAAHGTFRADNPLFSTLRLDDGPLTVHDLARLRRAPFRLVLSSCDSGVAEPVGADELLGLVSVLLPLGAAGILASVVPVNDAAVVPVMVSLHTELLKGATLAEALLSARDAASSDPVARAAALSFVALGL